MEGEEGMGCLLEIDMASLFHAKDLTDDLIVMNVESKELMINSACLFK